MTDKTIKSVRRVFEILKLFHQEQRPLSANEISRQLGYPLTSAHALLKSIHELGFADYDSSDWSYIPSRQLAELLDWINEFLDREHRLLEFMGALNQTTKETVNLSRRRGEKAKIIHSLESQHTVGVSVKVGTVMPLTRSLTGMTLLATLPEAAQTTHLDIESNADGHSTRLEQFQSIAQELTTQGSVCRCDQYLRGIGAVCIAVRAAVSKELMVVGMVGPSERITANAAEHRASLAALTKEFDIDCVFPFPS
ncbi:MAG: IclR family transcriptional regulator [Gammaproteobacteria bacterium]